MSIVRGKPEAGEPLGIQSIEVGLKLLRPMLEAGGSLNLKALADATGYAPPKAYRYLVSLIRAKLVSQDPITGRYSLGELAFELGLAAIGLLDRDGLGRQAIRETMTESGHTTCLVVWANGGATVAAFEPGVGSIFLGIRVGSILSLLRSASGRTFLAYMPRELTDTILKSELSETPLEASAIRELINSVRREGVSRIRDTMMVGLSAVAAPVFDHDGRLIYVLTTLGPSESFDTSLDGDIVRIVQGKASALSARLGFEAKPKKRTRQDQGTSCE